MSLTARQQWSLFRLIAFAYLSVIVLFIFLPVVLLVAFSFQSGSLPVPPFNGPSVKWYAQVLSNRAMVGGLVNSIIVGGCSALAATLLGFLAAYGVARHARQWRAGIELAMLVPASISYLVIGMGLMIFLRWIGIPPSLLAIGISHTVITLPIAFSLILSQTGQAQVRAELAAQDLGASEWKAIALITMPMLAGPIATAFFVSFSLSWDEFIMAFMLSRFEVTLPVEIWSSLRSGLNPFINAAGTVVFLLSLLVFLAMTLSIKRRQAQ